MSLKNEERFTAKANAYKKFRPAYPQELIDYLYGQAGFTKESVIADVGSGTGIFSRLLLERGSRVYGVEPNQDMQDAAQEDLAAFANFTAVSASAENTGLQEKSVDFVTAATAFHWFDRQMFKSECRRILKPEGKVVLIWNTLDQKSEIIQKYYAMRGKYSAGGKGPNGREDLLEGFFAENAYEYKAFSNDLLFDREGFIGRNLSSSYCPKEETDPEKYRGWVRESGELFDAYSVNGILHYPQFTQSFMGRV